MPRQVPFAIVLLLALLVAALCMLRDPAATATPSRTPGGTPASDAAAEAGAAPAEASEPLGTAEPERAPGPAERARVQGDGLHVLARWPDETPAAGVVLTMRGWSQDLGNGLFGREPADDAGRATFRDLPAGRMRLTSDRGDRLDIDVTGEEQEVVFELEGGIRVVGVVVAPDDRPVGGASVWLQTRDVRWTGGSVLATTDANGRFALDRVPPHVSLGAFAAGFTASALLDLDVVDTKAEPVEVRLQLGPDGGVVTGIVVDAAQQPIAGAVVGLGREDGRTDMRGERILEAWSMRAAETGADGRFVLVGIRPGKWPLSACAKGYGVTRTTIELDAGETEQVTVRMQPSGTIHGVATDASGSPAAGARIQAFDVEPGTTFVATGQIDFEEAFGHRRTLADADGAFVLSDVSAGTAHAFAQPGGKLRFGESVPHARAALEVPPGGDVEWNPVISEGRTIDGVVRYRDGHPMGDVFVSLLDEKTQQRHVGHSARDGTFRFTNLDASTYTVDVQYWDAPRGTPALQKSGVAPGSGRVELTAPFDKPVAQAPGTVTGRIDDVGARIKNPKAARVALMSDQRWFRDDGALVDGAFRFDEVEPCRFRIALMEEDQALAHSDWFELLPGSVVDTGVLRTEPGGAVHVTVSRAAGAEHCAPDLWLQMEGAPRGVKVPIGAAAERLVESVTPGTYRVTGGTNDMAWIDTTVTVAAGATTELPLTFRPGRTHRISVWLPPDAKPERYRYTVTGADGAVLRQREGELGALPTRPFPIVVTAPFGEWTLDFSADERWTGALTFRVEAAGEPVELRVDAVAR